MVQNQEALRHWETLSLQNVDVGCLAVFVLMVETQHQQVEE